MLRVFLLSVVLFSFASCKSFKNVEGNDTKTEKVISGDYFIIGEGGGFTGIYEQYKVMSDGTVEKWDAREESGSTLGKLDAKTTKEIFKELDDLELIGQNLYRPGNMNYSINLVSDKGTATIQWSDSYSPDIKILSFYKKVMNNIRKMK